MVMGTKVIINISNLIGTEGDWEKPGVVSVVVRKTVKHHINIYDGFPCFDDNAVLAHEPDAGAARLGAGPVYLV
jgi:hypothetical protein